MKHTKKYIPYIIIIGVIIIPLLYSYFYLGAFWDPYSKLNEVPVAVVNEDQGAVINDIKRNLGEELSEELKADGSLDFTFTDADSAKDGLESTKYYAVVTIPTDFSSKIATSSSTAKQVASVTYSSNEKRNYLASQILKSAVTTIEESLRSSVNEEIVRTLTDKLNEVPASLNTLSDGLNQLQTGASDLKEGTANLASAATTLNHGTSDLATGITALRDGADTLAIGTSSLKDGADQLISGTTTLSSGISTFGSKLSEYTKGVEVASNGSKSLVDHFNSLNTGIEDLLTGAHSLQSATTNLTELKDGTYALATGASSLQEGLKTYTSGVDSLISNITQITQALSSYAQQTKDPTITSLVTSLTSKDTLAGIKALQSASATLNEGAATLKAGSDALSSGTQNVDALKAGIDQISTGLKSAQTGSKALATGATALNSGLAKLASSNDALTGGATQLASGASSLKQGLDSLAQGLDEVNSGAGTLATGAGTAADGAFALKEGTNTLATGATTLDDGANQLYNGIEEASNGVTTSIQDTNTQLASLNGLDTYAFAPVNVESTPYAPVPNYGTAFAPYFMSLSLWVGGLMIFFGIYFDPDGRFQLLSRSSENVLKRSVAYLIIGLTQAVLLCMILLVGLNLTVTNLPLFFVACCLVSMTFITIIQLFLICFRNIGKFLAIALLILQLTSCGGTFPMETVPKLYNILYPFMPMTYSVGLFKETISGTGDTALILKNVGFLVIFMLGSLLLTFLFTNRQKKNKSKVVAPQQLNPTI